MNTEEKKIIQVAVEDIIPNRFQPRLAFDEEGLKELSESIKQHGIIQPLVLRRLGNKYEIIAGERRFKASTMAGMRTVPAIISDIDDNQSAEIALVENIQRRNLTPIEEAKSYKNLLDRGYMTQDQLAEKMGVSQSSIANKLRLLNLDPEVQEALLQEKISERHARSLLALPMEEQVEWLKKILTKRLTVRQLDLEIRKAKGTGEEELPLVNPEPNLENMINNATDINTVKDTPTIETSKEVKEDTIKQPIPNKFFNFLEDEAANMDMVPPKNTNIEVLDDFDETSTPVDQPVNLPQEEDTITPFFFEKKNDPKAYNNIEEIKEVKPEDVVVDPMDAVIKLDPNYHEIIEKEKGTDLKTAINKIRDLVNTMNTEGFTLSLDEIDLTDTYQMTINIKTKKED